MQSEFKMSMVREMCYFLGLQVKQKKDDIFISQSKYARNLIKKFDLARRQCGRMPLKRMEGCFALLDASNPV
ncbi:unnamed protein product [Rhodiola kirilowii]